MTGSVDQRRRDLASPPLDDQALIATLTSENARLTAELAEVREQLNASPDDAQFWLARIKVGNYFLLEAETKLEAAEARVAELVDGLKQIRARTYSNDRGCALGATPVAEIYDIARALTDGGQP